MRFGTRVIAVPSPHVLEGTAVAVMMALALAGVWLWATARSWSRRVTTTSEAIVLAEQASDTTYDAQIEAELETFS